MSRIRPSGGYRTLRSFRMTTIIYDATVHFCEWFIDPRSRTVDQMTQAARSGRQNIAEGCRASATSSQTELRLINVARASLDELLLDYEDYLRQHNLPQWTKEEPIALAVRKLTKQLNSEHSIPPDQLPQFDYRVYSAWFSPERPDIFANAVITLIHQANYLLDKLISSLEGSFVAEGGYTECLARARLNHRTNSTQENAGVNITAAPCCPVCGNTMVIRTARKGPHTGEPFWGCSKFPACHGTRKV